jgi:hypothetical protein
MHSLLTRIATALGLALSALHTAASEPIHNHVDAMWGQPVHYRIIQRPLTHQESKHDVTPPKYSTSSTATRPYSYGWFGTSPSPHWQRQFGYSRNHIQWSLK